MLYKKKWPAIIFFVPGFIMLFVFLYFPFLENIKNSFYDMRAIIEIPDKPWTFIGLKNYQTMLKDEEFAIAIWNTLKMMLLTVVFQVGIALLLAILVNNIRKGQQVFRTVFFFPVVISSTALGLLFKLFYYYDGGMLNQMLQSMGKDPVLWLGPELAYLMVVIPTLWSYVGFYFVILLTGLADISDDIYEAASIDGCTSFKQVFYITLPLLKVVLCTSVTLAVTGALKVFDLPWVIVPKGAPQGLTHFLGTYMYEQTFVILNFDYGAAIAILLVILGVVVSQVLNFLIKERD